MGYRTVVILNNDESSDWRKDEKLGDLISQASCGVHHQPKGFRYGTVVECVHADTQTIGILNTLCFETIEHLEDPRPLLKALRQAAPLLFASVPGTSLAIGVSWVALLLALILSAIRRPRHLPASAGA